MNLIDVVNEIHANPKVKDIPDFRTGDTIAVKIKGGGGGGLGTAINYQGGVASPFSYIDMQAEVEENMMLDSTKAGVSSSYIVTVIPTISVATGAAVTVGAGKTMIIDVLKIGDL